MRANRHGMRLVRILIAAAFGFMSLGHGPVMAFAKSGPAGHHQAANAHQHHAATPSGEHAMHHHAGLPDEPDGKPACYALGCFTAVSTLPDYEPKTDAVPLDKLTSQPPRDFTRLFQEPADPPPRLQV